MYKRQANDRLNRSASQLSAGLEPRLTVVLSDTFQSETFENMLSQIDQRYPALRFECLIAEYEDVVALVQQGRAHLGPVSYTHLDVYKRQAVDPGTYLFATAVIGVIAGGRRAIIGVKK